jgi:hypothetical protein
MRVNCRYYNQYGLNDVVGSAGEDGIEYIKIALVYEWRPALWAIVQTESTCFPCLWPFADPGGRSIVMAPTLSPCLKSSQWNRELLQREVD